MFQRFTDRARRIMVHAQEEAHRLNHKAVGTEHILLAILRDKDSVASKILAGMKIDLGEVKESVDQLVGIAEKQVGDELIGKLPLTDRTQRVIHYACDCAAERKSDCVTTTHILVGLLRVPEGVAGHILGEYNVTEFIVWDSEKSILESEKPLQDFDHRDLLELFGQMRSLDDVSRDYFAGAAKLKQLLQPGDQSVTLRDVANNQEKIIGLLNEILARLPEPERVPSVEEDQRK